MSLICLTDTKTILPLPTSRDHKRAYTGEIGPNTGGMGTYAPNLMAESFMPRIKEEILNPILKGLQKENMDYRGALFIGLMITDEKIEVLEFNVRFGDPETQVILELIDNDILELLQKTSEGKLEEVDLKVNDKRHFVLSLQVAATQAPTKMAKKSTSETLRVASTTVEQNLKTKFKRPEAVEF